jgi:hypothetical protein
MEMKKYLALSLLAWILVSCAEPENPGNPINEKETFLVAFKKLITSPVQLESNTKIEYDDKLRVIRITEVRGNGGREISQKMVYDPLGRISQILISDTAYPDLSIKIHWESDKISKAEWFEGTEFVHHHIYEYQNDRLVKFEVYGPNEENTVLFKFQEVEFTYDRQGHLSQEERFIWMEDEEKMEKISTQLYMDYTEIESPFHVFSFLPEDKAQKRIPLKYIYQSPSMEFTYDYQVNSNETGSLDLLQISSSNGQIEQVFFTYELK